jgi:dTDP-4-amino-4,6-dideoxygalactose transaminase
MSVPFIDLKRLEPGLLDRWTEKVRNLSENTAFIGGPEIAQLESALKSQNEVGDAVSCGNGTDALQLALRAVGVGRGDTVLLPDFTFWATFEAVVNVGADPVTVDIDPAELQMDFDLFCQAVDQYKPKAAMLVHLYGWASSRLADFRKFCKERGVILVEDGAQAYGATFRGESIYRDAEISTISFYPAKVLGAAGEAGAVLTSNPEYAGRLRSLANHGRSEHYSYGHVGWNSRMDAFQAAYLNLALEHLPARLDSRRKSNTYYREAFAGSAHRCVAPPADFVENGYLNVMIYEPARRDRLTAVLKEKGIGFGIVYPEPMSGQAGAQTYIKAAVGGEHARLAGQSVLSLPLFPYMTEAELAEVVQVVRGV